MEVRCDECNKHFTITNLKEKKHPKGIVETYFKCSACKKKYVAFVTNQQIRKLQLKLRNLRAGLSKISEQEHYNNKLREIESMQKTIEARMNELKERTIYVMRNE